MNEWVRDWFGYERHISTNKEIDQVEIQQFERIVNSLDKNKVVSLMELGSGWGAWCLALAGIRKEKYVCIAVEADPQYVELTRKHLENQDINATILHRAISDKDGVCRFNIDFIPFGQSITFDGRIKGLRILSYLWGVLHIIAGKTVQVQTVTIDTLLKFIDHVDIIQMDIQGTEIKAINGALKSIINKKIDYFMIGTHHKSINKNLKVLLGSVYDLEIDVLPAKDKDGLQIYKLKGLNE